ncbi:lipid A biosynthesis acyltransferase [Cytophagaceae bacterium ABcell3]|nr:lipid A biosynthesis acyltransferase [Cytophagaceae bacterium ABcell3]
MKTSSTTWKGKTRGGVLGYKIFIFILKKLGLRSAYVLLRFVAVYFVFSAPGATYSMFKYFRDRHGYSRIKSFISVYQNYYVFGQTLLDKIAILSGMEHKFSYTCHGLEHLKGLKETGGILISGHVGSWDIAGFMLQEADIKINILMFEAEEQKVKGYLEKVVKSEHVNIIPIKQDFSHLFLINNALKRKEIICMHGDRFVAGARVEKVNFLGKDAFFPLGPFVMASKLKVPFNFVYAVRGKNFKYHLSSTPAVLDPSLKPKDVLYKYVHSLEEKVKQYPLQWFNYYDFWSEDVKGGIYESNENANN